MMQEFNNFHRLCMDLFVEVEEGRSVEPQASWMLRTLVNIAEFYNTSDFPADYIEDIRAGLARITPIIEQVEGINPVTARGVMLYAQAIVGSFQKPDHPWLSECLNRVAMLACWLEYNARERAVAKDHHMKADMTMIADELAPAGAVLH